MSARIQLQLLNAKILGSGRSSVGPEGWHCPSCKFYNFSHRTVGSFLQNIRGWRSPALGGAKTKPTTL
eukprot:186479-Amphidinium_carterae.1